MWRTFLGGINSTSLLQTLPPLPKQFRDVKDKEEKKNNETRSLPQSAAAEQFLTKCYASGHTLLCGLET